MKWIFALVVCVGCSILGVLNARKLRGRVDTLCQLRQDALSMENNLSRLETPFEQLFPLLGNHITAPLYLETAAKLAEGKPVSDAWEASLMEYLPHTELTVSDGGVLRRFGTGLIAEDTDGQVRNLRLFASELEAAIASAEKDAEVKGKLYQSGGVFLGLLLAILFV